MSAEDRPEAGAKTRADDDPALTLALAAVERLKGESVKVLDVRALTPIADHMLVCTGRTARHVKRLGETVIAHAKQAGLAPRVEGLAQAEWVLIDLNGVMIHIMQPAARAYYQLEKLWDLDPAGDDRQARS